MESFKEALKRRYIVLDGATGTELAKMGMPKGVSPEKWILDHENEFVEFQKKYVEAGSDVIYAPTFSGNRIKLKEYGLENEISSINKKLVRISKKAASNKAYVAGDISPTGQFIEPYGPLQFEEVVDIYKEQALALYEGGVDLFAIETMMDIQETRAAILAIKEVCDLPIIVTMTFNEDGRTLMGNDPESVCVTLQSLNIDAVGCNCSTGPDKMIPLIKKMKKVAKIPLIAKPNAGMPVLKDGKTTFDMKADEFVDISSDFLDNEVKILGGCCGTDSTYIKKLRNMVDSFEYSFFNKSSNEALCTSKKTLIIGKNQPLKIIGEKINPSGNKELKKALETEDYFKIVDLADKEADEGACVVDVNVSSSDIDEEKAMINVIEHLMQYTNIPLCIDSTNSKIIEKVLRIYPGRLLVNSITNETKKMENLLPILKKYGAMVILLPIDDNGITKDIEKRKSIIDDALNKLLKAGIAKEDILIDGLVMTVASNQEWAVTTLETIKYANFVLGLKSIIGLSNISYGLPKRQLLNKTFLTMCMACGLSFAICDNVDELKVNLKEDKLMDVKYAADVLFNRDESLNKYFKRFAAEIDYDIKKIDSYKDDIDKNIYRALIEGKKDKLLLLIDKALDLEKDPEKIINNILLPAIDEVGILYESQKIFLPQLIRSGEAMEEAFLKLKKLLKKDKESNNGKVILATVKGDVHDIGKNIVALMLRNNGMEVIDLGKDVCKNDIIKAVKENGADILALSSLMTTTMKEMNGIIKEVKRNGLNVKVIVGGAVLSQKYADEIGADGYAKDAYGAVKLVKELLK